MDQYEQIMSVNSVLPFVLGYTAHGILAAIQLGIAIVLIMSATLNIRQAQEIKWLCYLGFTNNIDDNPQRIFGISQLVLAGLLLLPLASTSPVWLSILSFIFLAILYMSYPRLPRRSSTQRGQLARAGIMLFALVAIAFTAYERISPLHAMTSITQDVMHYRPLEQQWQNEYDVRAPKVGQPAAEFTLLTADGKKSVALSDFIGKKPVVLFLGANTCPVFSAGILDINRLHEKYKGRVNFVGVYVSEPHAIDEWPLARTQLLAASKTFFEHPVEIDIQQHTNYETRQWAANRLKNKLLHKDIPLLVDGMDNAVNNKWVGRPARLYVLDANGTVIYNPGKGPYGFNPAYVEPILDAYLEQLATETALLENNGSSNLPSAKIAQRD